MAYKDYLNWTPIKSKINNAHLSNNKSHHTRIRAREIYWIHFGENIGQEQDGKSELFTRPGVVLKTYGLNLLTVLPLTTNKKNDRFHFAFDIEGVVSSAILSQIRSIDSARVGTKIGKMDSMIFTSMKAKLADLLF